MADYLDKDRERFRELIWTRGEGLFEDLPRLRAFLADTVFDSANRDILMLAITNGIAQDVAKCAPSEFALRKAQLLQKLSHVANDYADWAVETLSCVVGPRVDPFLAYEMGRKLALPILLGTSDEHTDKRSSVLKAATTCLKRAAALGHTDACIWLAQLLQHLEDDEAHDSVQWLLSAGEQGNDTAQWMLGRMFRLGYGVEKSLDFAELWLDRAAKAGNVDAQCELKAVFDSEIELEHGVSKDFLVKWICQKAEEECDLGGNCVISEDGALEIVRRSRRKVRIAESLLSLVQRAASDTDNYFVSNSFVEGVMRRLRLGYDGRSLAAWSCLGEVLLAYPPRTPVSKMSLKYDWGCLSESGFAGIYCYETGSTLNCEICTSRLRDIVALQATVTHTKGFEPPDLEQPQFEWDDLDESMEKAAEQGHADAQFKLAEMLLAKSNPAESIVREAQSKSSSKDSESDATSPSIRIASPAGAMPSIRNKRPLRNYDAVREAISLLKDAAASGHSTAPIHLAEIYSEGIHRSGIYRDSSESLRWYLTAAKNGNVKAMCKIADLYMNGGVDSIGAANAVHWYREAATRGDVGSQLALADVLYYGIKRRDRETLWWYSNGKPIVDEAEAIVWYCTAVENGHPDSIEKLESVIRDGVEYGDGEDVREWLQRAAEEGHDAAKCRLEMVNKLIASANAELDEYEL